MLWEAKCASAKLQNPAKNEIQKIREMTDHTYACNDLTNFEYAVHAIAGNGSFLNWQKLEKLVNSLCENLFLAGFCVLEPLWCGGFVFLNAAYPLCCNDALALAGLSSVLPTHPLASTLALVSLLFNTHVPWGPCSFFDSLEDTGDTQSL